MRYVIKDPQVAKECAEENRVLGNIAKHLISRKRNVFVGKLDKYTNEALSKAAELGVEFTEVDTRKALKEIPNLNKEIEIVVETADRNLDAAEFCKQSCMDAVENGGEVLEETAIETIRYESTSFRIKTSNDIINCNFVVNATGAWANKIAQMVGVKLPLTYSQGTIAVQDTLSPRGIQCLRVPSDGDAYIVHGEYAWLGTTSTQIPSPDKAEPEE